MIARNILIDPTGDRYRARIIVAPGCGEPDSAVTPPADDQPDAAALGRVLQIKLAGWLLSMSQIDVNAVWIIRISRDLRVAAEVVPTDTKLLAHRIAP